MTHKHTVYLVHHLGLIDFDWAQASVVTPCFFFFFCKFAHVSIGQHGVAVLPLSPFTEKVKGSNQVQAFLCGVCLICLRLCGTWVYSQLKNMHEVRLIGHYNLAVHVNGCPAHSVPCLLPHDSWIRLM